MAALRAETLCSLPAGHAGLTGILAPQQQARAFTAVWAGRETAQEVACTNHPVTGGCRPR